MPPYVFPGGSAPQVKEAMQRFISKGDERRFGPAAVPRAVPAPAAKPVIAPQAAGDPASLDKACKRCNTTAWRRPKCWSSRFPVYDPRVAEHGRHAICATTAARPVVPLISVLPIAVLYRHRYVRVSAEARRTNE